MKLIFSLYLSMVISCISAYECNKEFVKRLNEETSIALLCSPLSEDRELAEDCFGVALATFVTSGTLIYNLNPTNRIVDIMRSLDKLDLKEDEKDFLFRALKEARDGKNRSKNLKNLLSFMSKKPELFRSSVDKLSRTLLLSKLSSFAKWTFRLSSFLLISDFLTSMSQSDCRALTGWTGIDDDHRDTRFVRFGNECTSMQIGNDFFSISEPEQFEVLQRSPKLCELAHEWIDDTYKIISNFTPSTTVTKPCF